MEERSQHRREEKEWLAERTSLSRRLQLLDRLGLDRLQPAGQKTEGRLESRYLDLSCQDLDPFSECDPEPVVKIAL